MYQKVRTKLKCFALLLEAITPLYVKILQYGFYYVGYQAQHCGKPYMAKKKI